MFLSIGGVYLILKKEVLGSLRLDRLEARPTPSDSRFVLRKCDPFTKFIQL